MAKQFFVNKEKGENGEILVAQRYQTHGYTLIKKNYTIAGGEIDLIVTKNNILTFIEVKVVDHIEDLHHYITTKKIKHIKNTIDTYLFNHPLDDHQEYSLDIVFVKDNVIVGFYENITNT